MNSSCNNIEKGESNMKPVSQIIILALAIFTSMASAQAQSPREQLQQMVEQLQKSPTDNALREKIIKLAQNIKPTPAVPEEVERRMARGEAAFESAKNVSGYDNAMREFQAAANAAPWYSNAYFNLGVAQEKAGKAKEAMESFRFYLLAAPDGKDAAEVKKRIYKLEYAAEQTAAQAVIEQASKNAAKVQIVPGKSIGLISLGMSMSEVESILGQPNKIFAKTSSHNGTYYYESVLQGNVTHDDRMNVIGITTWSSNYRTRLGVAVGANIGEARREFGEPREIELGNGSAFCFPKGIGMFVKGAGRPISYIKVQAPGGHQDSCW